MPKHLNTDTHLYNLIIRKAFFAIIYVQFSFMKFILYKYKPFYNCLARNICDLLRDKGKNT